MTIRAKRLAAASLALIAAAANNEHHATTTSAFSPTTTTSIAAPKTATRTAATLSPSKYALSPRQDHRSLPSPLRLSSATTSDPDCGCGNAATISGSPSQTARLINPKEALARSTVYRLDGTAVTISDLMRRDNPVSLIVLTRSFGCPFCQEQILQYSTKREELLANGVNFALISIGKPEVGLKLCDHLGIEKGDEFIYADPENEAYDNLQLNRGWDTLMRPATAFRFKDRIFGGSGSLDQLFEVLGKWKDAIYVPPKQIQATNQGGTFIFKGDDVVFAHYDESPGTHADTYESVDLAIKTAKEA